MISMGIPCAVVTVTKLVKVTAVVKMVVVSEGISVMGASVGSSESKLGAALDRSEELARTEDANQ